jgi:uncharacterized protein
VTLLVRRVSPATHRPAVFGEVLVHDTLHAVPGDGSACWSTRALGAKHGVGKDTVQRIFIGESDRWHGKPLYEAIVELVRTEGLAEATVVRGIEGFGADSRLHTSRILRLLEDLPVVIEVVDRPEAIDRILPRLDEMVGEGMLTVEKVHIIAYRGKAKN